MSEFNPEPAEASVAYTSPSEVPPAPEAATPEQLMALYSQVRSLFDVAQDTSRHVFDTTRVSYDPDHYEAVYYLPRQKSMPDREMHITKFGPGYILDYRAESNHLVAVRGMTLKADGLESTGESAVYEKDHVGFFHPEHLGPGHTLHYDNVPQNFVEIAQSYIDDMWASAQL